MKGASTIAELDALDGRMIVNGYLAARHLVADFSITDKGYWHGYLNGLCDFHGAEQSSEQRALAKEMIESGQLKTMFISSKALAH